MGHNQRALLVRNKSDIETVFSYLFISVLIVNKAHLKHKNIYRIQIKRKNFLACFR